MTRTTSFFLPFAVLVALLPDAGWAACNLIPGTINAFQSTLGSTNRPYAAPSEILELQLRDCDPSPPLTADPANHLVTVAFTPPTGAPYVAVMTADANCTAVDLKIASDCGGVNAECFDASASSMQIIDRDGVRNLSFRFPDSDDELAGASDDLTISGSARIAVSDPADAIPCGLATSACSGQSGLSICIDEFFANDGACGTDVPNQTFPSFTALPPPNDISAVCFTETPPCVATATEVRAALDANGNFLIPCGWQGTLIEDNGIPVPRLLTAQIESPLPFQIPDQVFLGSFTPEGGKLPPIFEPVADPNLNQENTVSFIGSADAPYTILRVARRHGRCQGGANNNQLCAADIDCPGGACPTTCVGSPNVVCSVDADCGGDGPCGELFDFSGFAVGGGLVVLPRTLPGFCQGDPTEPCANDGECGGSAPCVSYAMKSELVVPLDGLSASEEVRAFSIRESIDTRDRTGDDDSIDTVVILRSRDSGVVEPMEAPSGFEIGGVASPDCGLTSTVQGRPVARVSDPPFEFPAVETEGDLLAFLESEIAQNYCDLNGDFDQADAVLRVFQLGAGELTAGVDPVRAVDAALRIDGRSLAISEGNVFVRTSEASMARATTVRISTPFAGGDTDLESLGHSVSADGSLVAYDSSATNLLAPGTDVDSCNSCTLLGFPLGCCSDVFLRDVISGTNELISVATVDLDANVPADQPTISPSGRYVLFRGGPSSLPETFLRDRTAGTTELVSISWDGFDLSDGIVGEFGMSGDGRYIVFATAALNVIPAFSFNGLVDVYLRDRCESNGVAVPACTPTNTLVSTADGGGGANGASTNPTISDDGRYVAFASDATNLLPAGIDSNGFRDIFLYDHIAGLLERVNLQALQQGNGDSSLAHISPDGRYVAFRTFATNLSKRVDNNGQTDILLYDHVLADLRRVNLAPGGAEATGGGSEPFGFSSDGRYLVYESSADDLVEPADSNSTTDVFVLDTVTGVTQRMNVDDNGGELDDFSAVGAISASGNAVTFLTDYNFPGIDNNSGRDTYLRWVDPADTLGIDTLLFPDGALDDTVLEVFEDGASDITTLCPAGDVSVADGNAAFLRPESSAGTAECPGGSLNDDGDVDDEVVQLWRGSAVTNLARAATAVSLSATYVAALVSEDGNGAVYNGDGDMDDLVVQAHRVKDAPGAWDNIGQAADFVRAAGDFIVYITPEADQGTVLNGDGLSDDRVLQWYDAKNDIASNTGLAAEELVIGEPFESSCGDLHLVAFRVSEAAQNQNLNATSNELPTGDADLQDGVLHVLDLLSGEVQNAGQALTPCTIAECDPRAPYRVLGDKVKFITNEPQQGNLDLNGDGTSEGLVLQVYDFCANRTTPLDTVEPTGGTDPLGDPDPGNPEDAEVSFPTLAGRCLPLELGAPVPCDPALDTCGDGAFCQNDTCDTDSGTCTLQAMIPCADDTACQLCALTQPGSCNEDEDCPPGSECSAQVVIVATTVADVDDDGVPDDADNCPVTPNTDQADDDGDGVGNVCDAEFITSISGRTLVLKDKDGDPAKRKLVVISKDGTIAGPSGGQAPPTAAGATVTLSNPTTLESDSFNLPASGWTGIGKPAGAKGYKYKDKDGTSGPCRKAILKPGKLFKAVCKGDQISFSLDEVSQGSLAVESEIGGAAQCMLFGGDIKKDTQAIDGKVGVFKAKGAPVPVSCP